MQAINGFFGPFRFLSNFHYSKVILDGVQYRTTEHAYQAAKTLDLADRDTIRQAPTPRIARRLGQAVVIRPGWLEGLRDDVMYDVSIQKYADPEIGRWLLDTRLALLKETNTWGDVYWGVCNGVGQNRLGQILMDIRQGLQAIHGDVAERPIAPHSKCGDSSRGP